MFADDEEAGEEVFFFLFFLLLFHNYVMLYIFQVKIEEYLHSYSEKSLPLA